MPPSDGKRGDNTEVLYQIFDTVGQIKSRTEDQGKDIRDIKMALSHTVSRDECVSKHDHTEKQLTAMRKDILGEIKKPGTGSGYPAITDEILKDRVRDGIKAHEDEKEQQADRMMTKRQKLVTFWILVATFAGTVIAGGFKFVEFMNRVSVSIASSNTEIREELKEVKKLSAPVYVFGDHEKVDTESKAKEITTTPARPTRRSRRPAAAGAGSHSPAK